MRPLLLALLLLPVGGCAGQVRDFVGPRSSIVTPQLIRYGLDLAQARCVGERMGSRLEPRPLRSLATAAGAVKQGYFDPARLTMQDLLHVAGSINPQVRVELAAAGDACGVGQAIAAQAEVPAPPAPASAAAPAPSPGAPRPPTWLNLGAATTGQSIAIDAATIEQEGPSRVAWFRMTNPGLVAQSGIAYRLRVDCAARTIRSLAQRKAADAAEYREYGPPESNPLAVEAGTVMEIAWLSLCT
jgi:hypothetical protein